MFGYTSGTVSYAEELTSVSICYSQDNGFYTPLSIFYTLFRLLLCSLCFCWCSVVRSCTTSDDVNKYDVCTLPTPEINRPPHLDHHAHASLELQRLINKRYKVNRAGYGLTVHIYFYERHFAS